MSRLWHSSFMLLTVSLATACLETEPTLSTSAEHVTSVAEAARAVNVWQSRWNGAQASGYASGQFQWLQFAAWEDATVRPRTAFLNFWGNGVDPTSEVCQTETICDPWLCAPPGGMDEDGGASDAGVSDAGGGLCCQTYTYCYYSRYYWQSGWGEIPSEDFRVGGKVKTAQLKTNLAQNPNFYSTRCTYDSVAGTSTCQAITSGRFDVTWGANGIYFSSQNGTSTSQYGNYSQRTTGQSSSASADVSGTALGDYVTAWGDISQSKGNGVSREILQ